MTQNQNSENQNVIPIGQALREEREAQGYTLDNVSSAINIRVGQVRALEGGNLSELPGMAYAVGFVRSYAKYLGVDAEQVVVHFKREHTETPEKPELALPLPETENNLPETRLLVFSGIGVLFLIALWSIFTSPDEEYEEIAATVSDIPIALKKAVEKAEEETQKILEEVNLDEAVKIEVEQTGVKTTESLIKRDPKPIRKIEQATPQKKATFEPVAKQIKSINQRKITNKEVRNKLKPIDKNAPKILGNAKGASRVVIRAYKSSWIQVFNRSDKIIFKKVLRKGDEYRVPDTPGLKLVTTNAGVLDIYVDGKKVLPIGKPGDIVRGVSLNPDDLNRKRILVR